MTLSPSISTLGERALIDRLQARLRPAPEFVRVGIGDDAAVIAPERGMHEVATTDTLVEGIHFRRDWSSARTIGHKALAVNLSDLAAMGAAPRAALLSLSMPTDLALSEFDDLIDGFVALADRTGTALIGGNISRSPGPLVVGVTALGVVRPRRMLRRIGARRGDHLYVTGTVGGATAALGLLADEVSRDTLSESGRSCLDCHELPEPRLKFAQIVAKTGAATAAIDLSDGLSDAAVRLAEAAGLGVEVEAALVPVHPGAHDWFTHAGLEPVQAAVRGGEDYELAFAVPPRRQSRFLAAARRCPNLRVTRVGLFVAERGAHLVLDNKRLPLSHGYDHF